MSEEIKIGHYASHDPEKEARFRENLSNGQGHEKIKALQSELTRLRAENERLKAQQPIVLTDPWTAEKLPKVGQIVVFEIVSGSIVGGMVSLVGQNDEIHPFLITGYGWVEIRKITRIILLPADLLDGRREEK